MHILDAYSSFFFYATGVTPAMDSKVVGQGSQYMAAFIDSNGNPLDGDKNYKLHLPPNIPVANFWSVILYDNQTRSMLQTDQQWPAVSSQTKGLMVNPDSAEDGIIEVFQQFIPLKPEHLPHLSSSFTSKQERLITSKLQQSPYQAASFLWNCV
jgi:hypothetical protein